MNKSTLRTKVLLTTILLVAIFTFGVGARTASAASLTSSQISAIINLLHVFGADQSVINNVNVALTGSYSTPINHWPPIGYWPLDDATGIQASDLSGNGNHGMLTNMDATTDWVAGKHGGALDFDGGDDLVTVSHNPALDLTGPFAISVWIKPNSLQSTNGWEEGLVAKGATPVEWARYALALDNNDGSIELYSGNGSSPTRITSSVKVSVGQWYHIVGLVRGTGFNEAEIWVNGVMTGQGTLNYPSSNYSNLYIGQWRPGFNYTGAIDDVRIYNRAISATEIADLYRYGQVTTSSLTITTNSLPNGVVGSKYSATIYATGGKDSYKWEVGGKGQGLPAGLSVSQSVCIAFPCQVPLTISGIPIGLPGFSDFSVQLTSGDQTVMKMFSITVSGTSTTPSITVLSPNGGELWQKGTIQTIKWANDSKYSTGIVDIKLVPYYPPCTIGVPCPAYPYNAPYTIAKGVSNLGYYTWSVAKIINYDGTGGQASDGAYTVQICQTATNICDSSDSYFKIYSETAQPSVTNISPTSGLAGSSVTLYGTGFKQGAVVNIAFGSTPATYVSPDGTKLLFTVPINTAPGGYKVTVKNNDGTSESNPIVFTVTSTTQPSIHISVSSGGATSDSSINVNLGETFSISGIPQNLQGLQYWFGSGYPPAGYYNRAFFFNQDFGNNNFCGNNEATTVGPWTMTCTAKVPGSSGFYIEIYANGQIYRSNTVTVTINLTTQSTIDLASVFPHQSTQLCPTNDYVRTYTYPTTFSYPVVIKAMTSVHTDDYMKINGVAVANTADGNYCQQNYSQPMKIISNDVAPGFVLGQVPANTPIIFQLIDTIGLETQATGVVSIEPLTATATPPPSISSQVGMVLQAVQNLIQAFPR